MRKSIGKYLKKYENSSFMNLGFMTKGTEKLDYKIKKRLYSYNRLKKLLIKFNFDIIKKQVLHFFFLKKMFFFIFGSFWILFYKK